MKKVILSLAALALMVMPACDSKKSADKESKVIKTEIPARPEGATDLVGFATSPMDTVRVGFIGLGMRGPDAVKRFTAIPGAKVVAVCDLEQDRVDKMQEWLKEKGLNDVAGYGGSEDAWKQLCERDDIDLVYIVTDWQTHAPMALYAMDNGKHTAIEVPLPPASRKSGRLSTRPRESSFHCMMLENCVYDFFEMNTLNMAQQGLFGEVLHTEGSYLHDLTEFWPYYHNNWRMDFNQKHRGDVYPTHGMGPACQLLDIHRGDRMETLVSMDTKAVNGPAYIEKVTGEKPDSFAQGDHTMTMIRTANGKTIQIQHDVLTPRPTAACISSPAPRALPTSIPRKATRSNLSSLHRPKFPTTRIFQPRLRERPAEKALEEQYMHPIIREVGEVAKKVGGHGGMDYIMDYRLVYCLRNGLPLDMDVYDLAEWCSLIPLTAISIENGNAPVEVPDFTRGAWQKQKGYRHAFAKEPKE